MGKLIDGVWQDVWYETKKNDGCFVRKESQFRNWIGPDGDFPAEKDRYHLYVSLACPWASRTLIFRSLKGLEKLISVSVVHYYMAENGWTFEEGDGVIPDSINGSRYVYELYLKADPVYTGRVTVPILWDKKKKTIVNNESSEIIRMLNTAFDDLGAKEGDYYPRELRQEIDEVNARVYSDINNGVYKAGFATTQEAYEDAVETLFAALDWLEQRLDGRSFLVENQITEADWRLFTTLVRFDVTYVGHFKCNKKRIADYPRLSDYLNRLYHHPGIADTVNFEHIKKHYYQSHKAINPTGIVPIGPDLQFQST